MKEKIIQIMSEICPGVDFATETALIDDGLGIPWTSSTLSPS